VFKSKRITLLTIFALLLPSAGVATLGSSPALAASTDLAVFTVNGTTVTDGSTVDLEPYTTSVDVVATPEDPTSSVEVTGANNLSVGPNDLTVVVTDTSSTSVTYSVVLNVRASTDATATVTVNGEELSDGDNYLVPWGTSSVDVGVVTNDINATFFIDGDLDLQTGDNELTVLVTAADGVTTQTYTFNVLVLLNTDTSVNSITVNGTPINDGDFIDLDPLTTDVTVEVDTVDTDATVEVIGGADLVPGNNDLSIIITAADGETTTEYNVVLNVLPNTDTSLSVFNVAGVDVADGDYVTVDPLTTEVEINIETNDPDASYEVTGGTDLVPGENELTVTVFAADQETTTIYTVIIVVAPNTDTSLETFTVNGEDTDDGGVVYVPAFTESVEVEVVTSDPDATVMIDGNENLVVGDNTLTVIVTAADEETSQEYSVTVVVAPSNDASYQNINLSFDSPDGTQTISVVDGDEVELPSKTYSVSVEVETTDPESTYEVTGAEGLVVGENELVIVVTAPDGEATEEVYVSLIVAVGDVTTASFTVNDIEVADGDVIDLEPGTESVEVAVELTDPDATYEITGGDSLVLGPNELVLTVTSVDETLSVEYKVILNVLPSSDATATIEVNGIAWESEEQIIEVDAGDIDVAVNLNNEFATYEITNGDVTDFSGNQTITVEVTAQDGETREVYNISIIATSDLQIVPGSAGGDGELRVGSWIKLPRDQFDKQAKLTYMWFRNLESDPFMTGSAKYKLTAEDFGVDLRVAVGIIKGGQTEPSRWYISRAIEVAPGLIAKAPTPTIKGKAAVGNTLTATTKDWPEGAELTYQWYRDGDAIDGANSDSYEVTAEDFEASISVGITGTIEAYEPLEKVSTGVTIAAGTLRYSDKPAISGDFVTGGTVTVNPGTWLEGAEISIVWLRNGEEIATTTAEENSYVLTSEDYRTRLGVNIVVTAAGYKDATFKIKGRSIKIGTFADAPVPTISGDALVGETLEADAGEYPEGAEFTYVWKRNGRVISKANESSYTVTARDAGTTITVRVIAKIPGYKTVRIESEGVEALNAQ